MAGAGETLEELRESLARAADDGVRAGLHDAIATMLSRDGRLEEALAENLQAVGLRQVLADHDRDYRSDLSASLTNQGLHLGLLGRNEEAALSHLRALEILSQLDLSVSSSLGRVAKNAFRLGLIFLQLGQSHFAARFLGVALAARLVLVEEDFDVGTVADQRSALCLSLDRFSGAAPPLPDTLDEERLLAAAEPSFRTADYLSQWSESAAKEGDLALATVVARRVVTYCDLFGELASTRSLASLRSENARRADEICAKRQRILASASTEPDSRLWSISGQQLTGLVRELEQLGFPSSDVYELGNRLGEAGFYPARDCAYRCLTRPPQVFITYTWSDNFIDLQVAVRTALSYLGGLIREARPELEIDVVDRVVNQRLGVWIDFVFIDQSSRRLVEEVREVLPRALASADVHLVLSDTAMLRSWCCYEVALFNRPDSGGAARRHSLRSFIGRSRVQNYETFAQTSASQAADKYAIEQAIADSYPGGMSAFDFLLIQASMLSDSFVNRGFAQTQDAIDVVGRSVDAWLRL